MLAAYKNYWGFASLIYLPEKQSYDKIQFWKQFHVASIICSEEILHFLQNHFA